MDLTVTNDYTRDSMLKGCDEVIDTINKLFASLEVDKKEIEISKKSDSHLLEELGISGIEEGASRVENCELFKTDIVEEIER